MKVVLASASPRRKELLEQIGLCPVIMPSLVEEAVTVSDPEEVVKALSWQKAKEVFDRCRQEGEGRENILVIGSDTVVFVDGAILGKPGSRDEAVGMIGAIQGREHHVYTGVTMICEKKTVTFAEETEVHVYPMTREEILAYVDVGESLDKAGAYGIQGKFAAHIKGIRGSYTNVMGLPAGRVYQELRKFQEEKDD